METSSSSPLLHGASASQGAAPSPGTSPGSGPSADMLLRLRYDALMRQLEGMRALQGRCATRFFSWISLSIGVLLAVYVAASTLFPALQALLPFLVVTAGVQAAFFLHGMDFARVCARSLEARINRLLDMELLIVARLEDAYSYPLDEPKLGGVVPTRPERFFSAYALHWCCVWLFFFLAGALEGWRGLAENQRVFFAVLLASWAGANGVYLVWYFLGRHDLAAVERILEESEFGRRIESGTTIASASATADRPKV